MEDLKVRPIAQKMHLLTSRGGSNNYQFCLVVNNYHHLF